MSAKRDRVAAELETIRKRDDGILRPVAIVAFAKNKRTALHGRFCWDDSKAAHEYRLWQARELISVYVRVLEGSTKPVRTWVSLMSDRQQTGGGYRGLECVLRNPAQRAHLLAEAKAEMRRFRARYSVLKELANVFAAMEAVEQPQPRKRKRRKVG